MRIVHSNCSIEASCDPVVVDRDLSGTLHDQTIGLATEALAATDAVAGPNPVANQTDPRPQPGPVMLGDVLMVELAEGIELTGQVVWTTGDDCGVRFDPHIDSSALLTRLAACVRQGSTLPVKLPVTVAVATATRRPNGLRRIDVMEVAKRGLRSRPSARFTDGLHVKVSVPGAPDLRAVVRWSQDNIARVVLEKPSSLEGPGQSMSLSP